MFNNPYHEYGDNPYREYGNPVPYYAPTFTPCENNFQYDCNITWPTGPCVSLCPYRSKMPCGSAPCQAIGECPAYEKLLAESEEDDDDAEPSVSEV